MAAAEPELYRLFGVDPHASTAEIRAAYRHLIGLAHPDRATDEADRLARSQRSRQLNAAIRILGNPRARAAYDAEFAPRGPLAGLSRGLRALRFQVGVRRLADDHPSLGRLMDGLSETRGGQWLLVTATVAAATVVGLPAVTSTALVLAVAWLLARPGPPSPAYDALELVALLTGRVGRWTRDRAHQAVLGVAAAWQQSRARNQHVSPPPSLWPLDDQDRPSGPSPFDGDIGSGSGSASDEEPWSEELDPPDLS